MSHDPFQDLFEREIPRPASAAATRSTLDALAPQFHRAKSRRRARVSAVAAFAVLGTTGGAAALGVGPVALNNGPRADRGPVASSGVVENQVESTTTAVPTSAPTTTVTTTVPSIVPDIEITTTVPGDGVTAESGQQIDNSNSSDVSESTSTDSGDHSGDSADDKSSDKSSDDNKTSSSDKSDDSSHSSDSEDAATDPVPGPLTKSITEGSATVDIGPNGLLIVDITPSAGMTFEVKTKPDKIDIQFHDLVSGSELSDLEFELVGNGITVKVSHPD